MRLLETRFAVITGAAGGLGEAIARGMVAQGARVLLLDVDQERVNACAKAIRDEGGDAQAKVLDVGDLGACERLATEVHAQHGALDILVNNAGISGRAEFGTEASPMLWDKIMRVNLQGVFNVTHAFVPALKESKGNIVNLSSIVAFGCGISSAGYVAAKGAVRSLTQVLARDLAPYGIRTNAVAPGLMVTEMTAPQRDHPGGTDWYLSRVPMKRHGEADEIVGPVVFLASPMASYVNGAIVPVDGGYLAA